MTKSVRFKRLELTYKRGEVVRRLLASLLVWAFLLYVSVMAIRGLARGSIEPEEMAIPFLALVAGFGSWIFLTSLVVAKLLHPTYLLIEEDGDVQWRPMFSNRQFKLPEGAEWRINGSKLLVFEPSRQEPIKSIPLPKTVVAAEKRGRS
jgi:hypothetical protein